MESTQRVAVRIASSNGPAAKKKQGDTPLVIATGLRVPPFVRLELLSEHDGLCMLKRTPEIGSKCAWYNLQAGQRLNTPDIHNFWHLEVEEQYAQSGVRMVLDGGIAAQFGITPLTI